MRATDSSQGDLDSQLRAQAHDSQLLAYKRERDEERRKWIRLWAIIAVAAVAVGALLSAVNTTRTRAQDHRQEERVDPSCAVFASDCF